MPLILEVLVGHENDWKAPQRMIRSTDSDQMTRYATFVVPFVWMFTHEVRRESFDNEARGQEVITESVFRNKYFPTRHVDKKLQQNLCFDTCSNETSSQEIITESGTHITIKHKQL